jgi:hypothetical protein
MIDVSLTQPLLLDQLRVAVTRQGTLGRHCQRYPTTATARFRPLEDPAHMFAAA